MANNIVVRTGSLSEVWALFEALPEFAGGQIDQAEFEQRLGSDSALLLVAERNGTVAGFKAGYDRYGDGSFYSWLGGVQPEARRAGIAQALLESQEREVINSGFDRIYVKTRNRFVGMISLLLKSGYGVVGVNLPDDLPVADGRLTLLKTLRG